MISTPKGPKRIDSLSVGDTVVGYSELTGEFQDTRVVGLSVREVPKSELFLIQTTRDRHVIATPEHPFRVREGWILASQLQVGDEIFARYHKDKRYMLSPEYREMQRIGALTYSEQLSQRMFKDNPMKRVEVVRKNWQSHQHRPSKIELRIMRIVENLSLPVTYVGNGKMWIGQKNPDFRVEGQPKVIEVYDSTSYFRDSNSWSETRGKIFSEAGYKTLFLDTHNKSDKYLGSKLTEFVHNGAKVIEVRPLKGGQRIGTTKVYNLKCGPYHNYFAEGLLTHNCDTIPVWRKGTQRTFGEITDEWIAEGITEKLRKGAHLILTGGEPMLRQDELLGFLKFFHEKSGFLPYIEVETNGTRFPDDDFDIIVDQYNCSPKLSNSKMEKSRRINPKVMTAFALDRRAYFKFVIENPVDFEEMMNDYIKPFNIPAEKVYLMPECVNRAELQEKTKWVAELCKAGGFNFGNRLQVAIWDETTGV